MKKRIDKSPLTITTTLYIIVVLLFVSFYFINKSFTALENNNNILHKSGLLKGYLDETHHQIGKQQIIKISNYLNDLKPLIEQTSNKKLLDSLKKLSNCWDTYQNSSIEQQRVCISQTNSLDYYITRDIHSEQKDITNKLYIILSITIFATLYLIYFVRLFMEYQINKNAIRDHLTGFYNKLYFDEHFNTSCARAARNDYPLSTLSFNISNFSQYTVNEKESLLQTFGEAIKSIKRASDTVCRYDENHFIFVLPHTEADNVHILEKRITETIKDYDFNNISKPIIKFLTIEYDHKTSAQEHILKVEKSIHQGLMYFIDR